jgi:hypothetical protein
MSQISPRKASKANQFPDEQTSPIPSIFEAIKAANYAQNGAPFTPFLMKFAARADFGVIWSSERGDTPIDFYRYTGLRTDGFLPLGDYAITDRVPFGKQPIMLLAPDANHPDALAHPTDFEWILDDAGSGNSNDISYWWPVAPEGYQAVGVAFGADKPQPQNYWCVKNSYLQEMAAQPVWSDSGSHWKHHDGSLSSPAINAAAPSDGLFLTPTTFLSNEYSGNTGSAKAFALAVDKVMLPMPSSVPVTPAYDDSSAIGTATAQSVVNVAVIPASVVVDHSVGAEPDSAPFYYLAGLSSFQCTNAFAAPAGGTYSKDISVGTSAISSKAFQETNGVTVSASVGIAAGDKGGFNAQLSVTYNYEMQVTTSESVQNDSSTTESIQLNVPASNRVLLWQKNVEFVTVRTDGTRMLSAVYGTKETTFTPKPLINDR